MGAAARLGGNRRLLAFGAVLVGMLAFGSFASATAGPQPTTTALVATVSGNVVSVSITVSSALAAPTGTVTISVNGIPGDSLPLTPATATSSTATSAITFTPSDTPYTLVATYKTDNFEAFVNSPSAPVHVLIPRTAQQGTTTTLTVTPPGPAEGGTLRLSSTVTSWTGGVPTGTVTFATVGADGTTHFLAQSDLVAGATWVDVPSWRAGTYVIQASYGGDGIYASSAAQQTVTVAPAVSLTVDTTTTITVSPDPVPNDGTVTITAHVEQTQAHGPPAGNSVTFIAHSDRGDDNLGEAPLVDGVAVLHKSGWLAGHYTIEADYFGSQTDNFSTASAPLDVTAPSVIAIATPTAQTGQPVTLSATLTDAALDGLAGRVVTLSFGSDGSCTATTDVAGHASCTIANVVESAGAATATAAFAGDTKYSPSHATATVTVAPPAVLIATHLAYVGDVFAPPGSAATIAFMLTTAAGGVPMPGHSLTVVFEGHTYTLVTDSHGVAATTVTSPAAPGPHPVTAAFAGDASYLPSIGSGTLTSSIPTALSYIGDATVYSTGDAVLRAKLVSALDSSPVAQVPVTFTLATGEFCAATTDVQGIATCTTTINEPTGDDAVTLSFAGGGVYLASTGSGNLTVKATDTTVVLAATPPTLQGAGATLRATLTSTQTGRPLAGRTISFLLGSQPCSGVTNGGGVATCTIGSVTAPVGYAATSASFAGDAAATRGSATGTALVYQLAPGGGIFVVGDRSALGSVTFWGALWAKLNSLSRGGAPDAFKGFADAAMPQCGATWTTRPGNSTPPPSGPLPAYMAVIVSSTVGKSGATISGDVQRIVVVNTAAGYASDPGHPGTGRVVATVCPAG